MKTDSQLKKDVEEEVDWDPELNAAAIGVLAKNGVVTLTGHIDTFAEKSAAERAVRRVGGVKAISVELDVKLSPSHQRSDTDIAEAARTALVWNTVVADKVQASVENGWLTLRGEVEWDFQRESAQASVHSLAGVRGISNLIMLKPRVQPENVKAQIAESFKRQAAREANRIEVKVDGSAITLAGKVNSWHERDAAQGVAWSIPGVRTVVNQLVIE